MDNKWYWIIGVIIIVIIIYFVLQ